MLKKYKENQIYKFDYGNPFKRFLSFLIQFMLNSCIVIFSFVIYFCLFQFLVNNLGNKALTQILGTVITIIFVAVALLFLLLTFLPKRIILSDGGIKIRRNSVPPSIKRFHFNDFIPYSSIQLCGLYDKEINYRRAMYLRKNAFPFFAFNWKSLVKITDKYNNAFYLPIKNAKDFVEAVNKNCIEMQQ